VHLPARERSEPDQPPVNIPTVVLTVHKDGVLTATLDGAPLVFADLMTARPGTRY